MRPILLAMNNPLSPEPEHALFPAPEGCSGHRLWKMLEARRPDLHRRDYLRAFDRRNLLPSRTWDQRKAREAARALWPDLVGRTVVVLGAGPRDALGLEPRLIHPVRVGETTLRQVPHPSGRCYWYNDPTNRMLVGMLLEELYEQSCM